MQPHGDNNGVFVPPEWCVPPLSFYARSYSLEVLKDGVIISEIPLHDRAYFLLGRQHDKVDIPMDHASISRVHAALCFHKDGYLMLCDLQSAQGTYINKKMISKGGNERVNVGDLIRFGASTRLYIVKGPIENAPGEYDSAHLEVCRLHLIRIYMYIYSLVT